VQPRVPATAQRYERRHGENPKPTQYDIGSQTGGHPARNTDSYSSLLLKKSNCPK